MLHVNSRSSRRLLKDITPTTRGPLHPQCHRTPWNPTWLRPLTRAATTAVHRVPQSPGMALRHMEIQQSSRVGILHVGPGCGSVMVRGASFFIYFFNVMFLFCFSYSVHDGTEPEWRQQRWWLDKVLPVSVLYNNLLLLPVESAGPMFLSIFVVVWDGKINTKHLLIGTANA